mmetsp:Transcript_84373/g.273166  ORF Transcript_84373/g.273166 Transcript_84373/m.273166 type:complete len:415 (+) Transcript_84373:644-1888(+)
MVERLRGGPATQYHDLPHHLRVVGLQQLGDAWEKTHQCPHAAPPMGHSVLAIVAHVPDVQGSRDGGLALQHRAPHCQGHLFVDGEDDLHHGLSTQLSFCTSDVEDAPAEEKDRQAQAVSAQDTVDLVLGNEPCPPRAACGELCPPSPVARFDVGVPAPVQRRPEHLRCLLLPALLSAEEAQQCAGLEAQETAVGAASGVCLAVAHSLKQCVERLQLPPAASGTGCETPLHGVATLRGAGLYLRVRTTPQEPSHEVHCGVRLFKDVHCADGVTVAATLERISSQVLEPAHELPAVRPPGLDAGVLACLAHVALVQHRLRGHGHGAQSGLQLGQLPLAIGEAHLEPAAPAGVLDPARPNCPGLPCGPPRLQPHRGDVERRMRRLHALQELQALCPRGWAAAAARRPRRRPGTGARG